MKINIFSLYDTKGAVHSRPLFAVNQQTFERELMAAVNEPQSIYCKHAADFSAFHLGTFDDSSAKMELLPQPAHLYNLLEFRNSCLPSRPTVEDVLRGN